jgi:hypothetical protein
MGEVGSRGFGRRTFTVIVLGIAAVVVLQSVVHLLVTLGFDRIDTIVDLDRSNGLPDLASTVALAAGAAGAAALARPDLATNRATAVVTACLLSGLTLADFTHDGAHPFRRAGPLVIGAVVATALLLAVIGANASGRVRVTLVIATLALGCSFAVAGLHYLDSWFDQDRGKPEAEVQIVAKEGLELLGWSLVALALWEEALRRRNVARGAATARASRAPAPSTRRAA